MRKYLIKIKFEGGQTGLAQGLFSTDWDAIDAHMGLAGGHGFVTVRRLS